MRHGDTAIYVYVALLAVSFLAGCKVGGLWGNATGRINTMREVRAYVRTRGKK